MAHDHKKWPEAFRALLEDAELQLAIFLRNHAVLIHYLMRIESDRPILEVGAGTGRASVLMKLLQPHRRVVATDINGEVCEIIAGFARAGGVTLDEITQADATKLPYPDDGFGVVFSAGLLEHFEDSDINLLLAEMLRVAPCTIVVVPVAPPDGPPGDPQNTGYGDERWLSKTHWLKILTRYAGLLDLSFSGPMGSEEGLLAVLVRKS